MQARSLRPYCPITVFLFMAATCGVTADPSTISEHRASMSNQVAAVRALQDQQLRQRLWATASGTQDTPLTSLWPAHKPEQWFSGYACKSLLKNLWILTGTYKLDGDVLFDARSKISADSARECILRSVAFDELCIREDGTALEFLISRTNEPSSILDACLFGRAMWGDAFSFVPEQSVVRLDPGDVFGPTVPLGNVPVPSSEAKWRDLFTSKNGVYRWLALKMKEEWLKGDDSVTLVEEIMADPFIAVRGEWPSAAKTLSPTQQVHVCERYIDFANKRQPSTDAVSREIESSFLEDVSRRLQKARQEALRNRSRKTPRDQ